MIPSKKAMAGARFTPVTLKDFQDFFRRGFAAVDPKVGNHRGEVFYDLPLSEKVVIRVFTSVGTGGSGAGHGEDAIRLTLCRVDGRPLVTKGGKWPIVKRTQNWRDNLRDLIGEHMEMFYSKEDYWNDRASS